MTQAGTINKRKVFYLSGFDPRGAAYYYGLYKKEAENYARRTGKNINIGKRSKTHVNPTCKITASGVSTDYEFLKWDDIVRANWSRSSIKLYLKSFRTYLYYFFSGTVKRGYKIAWEPIITFTYPFLLMLLVIAGSIISGVAAFSLVPQPANYILAPLAAILAALAADRKLASSNAYWLMQLYNFCNDLPSNPHADFKERMAEFAKRIEKEMASGDHDEVLLVAHSAGSICIMYVLKNMLGSKSLKKLKIITLGQCAPLLGLSPKAKEFQSHVKKIASEEVFWLDVTAPSDGACFAFTGPFAGICKSHNPLLKTISARFHKMFSEEKYRKVKRNKLLTHFLYLRSPDNNVEYDYFAITTGNISLEKRFAAASQASPRKKQKGQGA